MHIVTTRCCQILLNIKFYHLLIAVMTYRLIWDYIYNEQLTGIICDYNEAVEEF